MEHPQTEPSSRARLLKLLRLLEQYTDEKHPLSTNELAQLLKEHYGITAFRTTLYKDLAELAQSGVDLVKIHSTQNRYFIGSRLFELPELKLLIDAIDSSKCLTADKSRRLIDKLLTLMSTYQAAALREHPLYESIAKPSNDYIYYIIDAINHAIEQNRRITFCYIEYTPEKQRVLRGGGEVYSLSPYACMWSGDYYYVIGWSDKHEDIVAFRVDRIAAVPTVTDEPAAMPPSDFDLRNYCRSIFSMYSGEITRAELLCDNELMKTIIDRFGEDVQTAVYDDDHFVAAVDAALSPTFYGWIFEFGGKLRLLSPKAAVDEYRAMLQRALAE